MDEVQVTEVRRKHGRVVRFWVWVSGKRPVESDLEPDAVDDDPAEWLARSWKLLGGSLGSTAGAGTDAGGEGVGIDRARSPLRRWLGWSVMAMPLRS